MMLGENVALEKSAQSSFLKAVKGIQRIIKNEPKTTTLDSTPIFERKQRTRVDPKPSDRGVVYLTHVPHGFYEKGIKSFFTQFGEVSAVKLVRSKKTGKSRGFAFIEFLHTEVAKVAAETMNNYLMFNRLLKAEYIPPDKQRRYLFNRGDQNKLITAANCTSTVSRKKYIKRKNKQLTEMEEQRARVNSLKKLGSIKTKLNSHGIAYNLQPTGVQDKKSVKAEDADTIDASAPVIYLDESDTEFSFKVPQGAIVKSLKRGVTLSNNKTTLKKNILPVKKPVKSAIPSLQKNSQRTVGTHLVEKAGLNKVKKAVKSKGSSLNKEKHESTATVKDDTKKKGATISKINADAKKAVDNKTPLKIKKKAGKVQSKARKPTKQSTSADSLKKAATTDKITTSPFSMRLPKVQKSKIPKKAK